MAIKPPLMHDDQRKYLADKLLARSQLANQDWRFWLYVMVPTAEAWDE